MPWPKMVKMPSTKGSSLPSISMYCWFRNLTIAWPTVILVLLIFLPPQTICHSQPLFSRPSFLMVLVYHLAFWFSSNILVSCNFSNKFLILRVYLCNSRIFENLFSRQSAIFPPAGKYRPAGFARRFLNISLFARDGASLLGKRPCVLHQIDMKNPPNAKIL